jgi:pimeloyl-ACP methyl ester carboxylesterase
MISFQEFGNENNKPLILLSPGISDSSYWDDTLDIFLSEFHIFAMDYPGRKGNSNSDVHSINGITELIHEFIESKDLKNVNIVGYSLGSAITIELLLSLSGNQGQIGNIVLIAPGEYLKRYRYLINIIFFPARYSNLLRLVYRRILLKAGVFKEFPRDNLDVINKQWLSIINWKLPAKPISYPHIEIINLDKDVIVDKDSKESLRSLFSNAKFYSYPYSHFLSTEELIRVMRNTVLVN